MSLDLVTVGRISVDLYAHEAFASFRDPQTFSKSVGGSPTNVAVAAARLGRSAAVVTKVGDDDFGRFALGQLTGWGVTTDFVGTDRTVPTPLAFAALDPPEDPQVVFYRGTDPPDTTLVESDLPGDVVRGCRAFWMSTGALAHGTTARASFAWLEARSRASHTILDLDYRPRLWPDVATARAAAGRAIGLSTIVVGNRAECEMALGTSDPSEAAAALIDRGVELAVIKQGGGGVLLATGHQRFLIEPLPVAVVCGLGAGDAFGGALVHGLLSGWDLPRIGRFANAAGAFVVGQLTCADAMPTASDLDELLALTARATPQEGSGT
ncbi:MAG: 5-dehydro-2-deoxygluconokinase [Actinobacteria bacterium]|jgi:5-dehydro-2-deoxygluconokinase|nr:5-dehydro-2-deoxygluconokinase [Actinomycetota bacterium]